MGHVDDLEPEWEWMWVGRPSPTIDPLGWSMEGNSAGWWRGPEAAASGEKDTLDNESQETQMTGGRSVHLMHQRPPLVRILLVTRKPAVTVDKGTV